ncbi:GNAT family N-acetyltransferase [Mangrovimonas aestuarii]|uniref:GNAT family N-acetyltransferase n=1 Tax=Mangrovimonas aestuarii TaxID=3018443 RepID=UPI0023792B87|nr:GNAT family N-acetyltransferase [Mangrovimonas aestuarii]
MLSKNNIVIREIKPEDNAQIEAIIKAVFHELELPLQGTAYTDPETSSMYESYKGDNEVYFVIEKDGELFGGAGVKSLKNHNGSVCELQKMYFSTSYRNRGYGKLLFEHCLKAAKNMGYGKCYLETASQLKAAIHVYESFGFKRLKEPMGETGHFACGIWMIKTL